MKIVAGLVMHFTCFIFTLLKQHTPGKLVKEAATFARMMALSLLPNPNLYLPMVFNTFYKARSISSLFYFFCLSACLIASGILNKCVRVKITLRL